MAIYKLPSESEGDEDSDRRQKTEQPREKHKPEFIFLDDFTEQHWEEEAAQGHAEYFESLHELGKESYPLSLRFFTFSASIVMIVCALAVFTATCVAGAVSLLTFRRSDDLNRLFSRYFEVFKKLIVFSLGTFLATFSPPLGLGLIVLFFMVRGEKIDSTFINRFMQNRF